MTRYGHAVHPQLASRFVEKDAEAGTALGHGGQVVMMSCGGEVGVSTVDVVLLFFGWRCRRCCCCRLLGGVEEGIESTAEGIAEGDARLGGVMEEGLLSGYLGGGEGSLFEEGHTDGGGWITMMMISNNM